MAHAAKDTRKDFAVVQRFPWGIRTFPVPLQPAAGVNDRTVFFSKAGGWQAEHFGLDFRRVDIVNLAVVLPEVRGFGVQRVDGHEEFQLRQ
ncbi:hypothetical protein D3C75_928360 [compost metagenome]